MLDLKKHECSGCGACYSSCPMHCISMRKDEEGFEYPIIDHNLCIACGKCERSCPSLHKVTGNTTYTQTAYAACTKKYDVWKRSSSGGAFSEICDAFEAGDNKVMFVGAAWDGLNVHHKCVIGKENIGELCKSKYVFSSTADVFAKIKNHLANGNKVLFCGTPCQVAGLKSFLNTDYPNLFLIDLICHGVGSQDVFKACINKMEQQFGKQITSYEFRAKRKVYETDHISKIVFGDNEKYCISDPYIQLFLGQECLKPSCGENCIYRTEHRMGDVTIADFKGLTQVFPGLKGTKKNYSTIVVNSPKGDAIVDELKGKMELIECKIDDIKKYNPLFYRQTKPMTNRDDFFVDYCKSPFDALDKWTVPAREYKKSTFKKMFDFLPVSTRKAILRFLRK